MHAEPDARQCDQCSEADERPPQPRVHETDRDRRGEGAGRVSPDGIELLPGTATSGWIAGSATDGRGRSKTPLSRFASPVATR